jgi:hypothetical protein
MPLELTCGNGKRWGELERKQKKDRKDERKIHCAYNITDS